ncbi:MAG TPA: outer membrane protein transport protein [Smithella sp.]|nr:outer membrane protein transport protein [Smithella sp.]
MSRLHTPAIFVTCIIVAASLFLRIPQAEAMFTEDVAIDPEAISLANTVTARPPGIAALHYNPAGLSLMGDGDFITQGLVGAVIKKTNTFTQDPNYRGFNDIHDNLIKDPLAGTSGTNNNGIAYIPILDITLKWPVLPLPLSGLSHREPGSNWTFGFSIYTPYAGGWNCNSDDPSRFDGQSLYLQHLIYFGPGVSYRVSKTFSIGASFGAGQTAMGIGTDVRAPNAIVNITRALGDATQGGANPISDLTIPLPLFGGGLGIYEPVGNLSIAMRDDFSPSYTLGALWEPYDWLSFGLSYNSAIDVHMTGKYIFSYSQQFQNMVGWEGSTPLMVIISSIFDLPMAPTSAQIGNVSMDMQLPQLVNFGVKLKPIKRLSLLADLHWSNWSTTSQYVIQFDQRIQLFQLAKFMGYTGGDYNMVIAKNMKDTLTWSAGIEYQATDWLALRAGYEKRTSSFPDNVYDLMSVPTMDYYGGGLGIKLKDNIDIDICFGYLTGKQYTPDNGSVNLNSTVLGAGVNNPYAGLNVQSEMSIFVGGFKVTMPLEDFLDQQTHMLNKQLELLEKIVPIPARHTPAQGSLKPADTGKSVDTSSMVINNLRPEGASYYTEDSD